MCRNLLEALHFSLGGIVTDNGELAWDRSMLPHVLELATKQKWIILGGDVLTETQKYTYDNWYYEVNLQHPLDRNVKDSVDKCEQYISDYVRVHGKEYLFVLVISDAFVSGV